VCVLWRTETLHAQRYHVCAYSSLEFQILITPFCERKMLFNLFILTLLSVVFSESPAAWFRDGDEVAFAEELAGSELAAIAPELAFPASKAATSASVLPLVFLHGMGDSCFNRGMANIAEGAGNHMGVYSVCIPTGDTRIKDILNGFILSMDDSVDIMAQAVQNNTELANGFNCVGLSQGNNLCRGYIQKYNGVDGMPIAVTHISIHGPVVGVASLPSCEVDGSGKGAGVLCKKVSALLGKLAYKTAIQNHLFQANYFRQVKDTDSIDYKDNSQMAAWNNEGTTIDATIKENFAKTSRFAMIKANADTVVVPREGEWYGCYDENYNLLDMKETLWYVNDSFGLRTADEAGKIVFNSTEGNHLDFSTEQLFGWLDLYAM
jgi:palmitoyl-protein thioesterase